MRAAVDRGRFFSGSLASLPEAPREDKRETEGEAATVSLFSQSGAAGSHISSELETLYRMQTDSLTANVTS